MEPHYVTFEQAKLLKELGFNEQCRNYYTSIGKEYVNGWGESIVDENGFSTNEHNYLYVFDYSNFNRKQKQDYILAPEQHQVVEWLRVNHGVWVHVEGDCYGEAWFTKLTICSKEKWENLEFRSAVNNSRFYNFNSTPQEAYSAAFDYILPILIK